MSEASLDLRLQIGHLLDIDRAEQARPLLARLLQSTPDDPEALFLAARLEMELGQTAAARQRVGEVLARAPGHAGARLLLFGLDFDDQRFDAAEATVLDLLREDPDDPYLLAMYGRLMLRVFQLEKARALVDEALRRAPELPLAQVLDALLHVIHGDEAGASARLAQLVAQDPESAHVAMTAMVVLQTQHRPREALEVGRQLLRTRPGDGDLIDMMIEARLASHWTMKPLWPFLRFGWGASIGIWIGGIVGLRMLGRVLPRPLFTLVSFTYFAFIVYSWVWPPLLRRWLRRRGF